MFANLVESLAKSIAPAYFERSGSGMEPDPAELEAGSSAAAGEKHLYRLFVGWVPKLFTEQDLLPLFQKYGDVRDIIILKDKISGQPRGCAFVSYATQEEAEAAISALDKGVQLPGALCPMEVRYARSHQYVQAGTGPQDNRQLFFARAPVLTTEAELRELFGQFGEVEDVNLFRERRTHLSKGCGFVTMATREQALAAMNALDEKQLLEGSMTPLAVKWADPDLQIKKRRAVEDSNAENRMLFFAKVLRSASEEEVRALFSRFGRVVEVNLFRAFQGAPTTKGCGLVTMGSNEEAAAAIQALDSRHVWQGMEAPMVVKWMDAALQKRRREEHLAAMRQGLVPSMSMTPDMWVASRSAVTAGRVGPGATLSQGKLLEAAAAAAAGRDVGLGYTGDMLPAGCAPDAYKLFVGNIPKCFTEEDLRPLFQSVGPVVELVVVRDKFSHESKGSAFVWYRTKADADQAVMQFNLCRVLQDPTGEQDRPLVVRRANMRKPAASLMMGMHGMGMGPGAAAAAGYSSSGSALSSGSNAPAMPGLSSGSLGFVELQQQPGVGGMSLGSDVPLHLQPAMAMQMQHAQVGVPPGRYGQHVAMYQPAGLSQQGQLASSDLSSSGSFMLQYAPHGVAHIVAAPMQQQQAAEQQQQLMQHPQQLQHPQHAQQLAQQQQQQLHHQQAQAHQAQQAYYIAHAGMVQPAQHVQQASPSAAAALAVPRPHSTGGGAAPQQPPGGAELHQASPQAPPHPGAGAGGLGPMVHLSLQLTAQQMGVVGQQLYSVAQMSGAEVSTSAAHSGLYFLAVTGPQAHVNAARQLITSLLSQAQAGAGMV